MLDYENSFKPEINSIHLGNSQLTLEWLAVLSAKDITYHVSKEEGEWHIEIDASDYQKAITEITAYENERSFFDILKMKREGRLHIDIERSDLSIFIGLLLVLFYLVAGSAESKSIYHLQGTLSGFKVFDGEWWRLVTALTLHADAPHIFGNTIFLIIFASSACSSFGAGFAWLFIVLSGIIGNYLTICTVWPANHCAIGASTAVFGALGIIAAYRVADKLSVKRFHYTNLIPLFAATAIFALTGATKGTDVRAHLLGLTAGIVLGLIAYFTKLRKYKENYVLQILPFSFAVIIVGLAWFCAFY